MDDTNNTRGATTTDTHKYTLGPDDDLKQLEALEACVGPCSVRRPKNQHDIDTTVQCLLAIGTNRALHHDSP